MLLRHSLRKLKEGLNKHLPVPAEPKGSVQNAQVHQIRTPSHQIGQAWVWVPAVPVHTNEAASASLTHQTSAFPSGGWESSVAAVWSCFAAVTMLVRGDMLWRAKSY